MFVKYKIKGLNVSLFVYISISISIIQDSMIICKNPVSSAFIGELVFLKENYFKGIVFEVNLKSIIFLGVLFNLV